MTDKQIIKRYYIGTALSNAYFPLGTFILYFAEHLGFGFSKALLISVVAWGVTLLFDILGGVYADKFGRKKSYVLGIGIVCTALLISLTTANFYIILALYSVIGIGQALESESFSSLITQALGPKSSAYKNAVSKNQAILFISRAFASIIGGLVYLVNPALPFLLYTASLALSVLCIRGIVENIDESNNVKSITTLLQESHKYFKLGSNLFWLYVSAFAGLFALDLIWGNYTPFFSISGLGAEQIGYIYAGISILSALGSYITNKLHKRSIIKMALVFCFVLSLLNSAAFMVGTLPVIALGIVLMSIGSGIYEPCTRLYIAQNVDNTNRSSVASIASTIETISTMLGFGFTSLFLGIKAPELINWLAATLSIFAIFVLLFRFKDKIIAVHD
jgi:MFS family permease